MVSRFSRIGALLLAVTACASLPRAARDEFTSIYEEAGRLGDRFTAGDGYHRLARRLETVLAAHPGLKTDDDSRAAALAYLARYRGFEVRTTLAEPAGPLYYGTGLRDPLRLRASWAGAAARDQVWRLRVTGTDGMLFPSQSAVLVSPEPGSTNHAVDLRVGAAARGRNEIRVAGQRAADPLLEATALAFGRPATHRITPVPAVFRLTNEALHENEQAEMAASRAMRAVYASATGTNESLVASAAISSNGQFTFGARANGQDFDLLYGHPNGVSHDGIWSSVVSLLVDGKIYLLPTLPPPRIEHASSGAMTAIWNISAERLEVRQTLTPWSRDGQAAYTLSFSIKNLGWRIRSVGIRVLFDTWTGMSEVVPLLVPRGKATRLAFNEMEFSPSDGPLWQTFDLSSGFKGDGTIVFLRQFLVGDGLVPPDRVSFVYWPTAYPDAARNWK